MSCHKGSPRDLALDRPQVEIPPVASIRAARVLDHRLLWCWSRRLLLRLFPRRCRLRRPGPPRLRLSLQRRFHQRADVSPRGRRLLPVRALDAVPHSAQARNFLSHELASVPLVISRSSTGWTARPEGDDRGGLTTLRPRPQRRRRALSAAIASVSDRPRP